MKKKKDVFVIFHSVVLLSDILLLSWRRKSFCLNGSTDYALVYVRYQGTVILGAQTVIEWMGVKRRWGEQTDKRATSVLEQQQLNNRLQIDFSQAFQMIFFFFYTHTHMLILTHTVHALAHPLRDRKDLELPYLNILWVSILLFLHCMFKHPSVREKKQKNNTVTLFGLPRSRLYTFHIEQAVNDGWWQHQAARIVTNYEICLLRAFLMRDVKMYFHKPNHPLEWTSKAGHHLFITVLKASTKMLWTNLRQTLLAI